MKTFGRNLKQFIKSNYKNRLEFCEKLGVSVQTLSNYSNEKTFPQRDFFQFLVAEGCNLNWLFGDKSESMYSSGDKGKALRRKNNEVANPYFQRILDWISDHYDSPAEFCREMNYDINEFEEIVYEEYLPTTDFFDIIREAGCNMKWVETGKGGKYNLDSERGLALREQFEGTMPEDSRPRKQTDDLEDKIRSIIREEIGDIISRELKKK